jgi:uncharacterized protein
MKDFHHMNNRPTAAEVIALLGLQPLPQEGGYFRETYRSAYTIPAGALPSVYEGKRNVATAIYFLITPDECSALHILPSDEVFHFYAGDAVEMLLLHSDGAAEVRRIGVDFTAGERPQVVVPGGVWQGCRLAPGGEWALLGCTVGPGFDFRDFHVATPAEIGELQTRFPEYSRMIESLSPR